jgi:hypothetical protein
MHELMHILGLCGEKHTTIFSILVDSEILNQFFYSLWKTREISYRLRHTLGLSK